MEFLAFKIMATLGLVIFFLGLCAMALRRHHVWQIIGQIMALKGVTFGAFILMSRYEAKAELLTILVYTGVFVMVLAAFVGFSLLVRSGRFRDEK